MLTHDQIAVIFVGPIVGLGQNVRYIQESSRQLFLVFHQARRVVDDPGHCGLVEVHKSVATGPRGHERGVLFLILLVSVHYRIEIGVHLEVPADVLVHGAEHLYELRAADHNHLGVNGYSLGPQSGRRQWAILLPDVLDADLPAPQAALKRLPGEGTEEHVPGLQHQVAAVGPVKRARLYHREIRCKCADPGAVIDTAKQVVVGRAELEYHRPSLTVGVVHQAVHLVADEEIVTVARQRRHLGWRRRHWRAFAWLEYIDVPNHIRLVISQELNDLRKVGVLSLQLVDYRRKGYPHDLGIHLICLVGGLFVQPPHLAGQARDFVLNLIGASAEALPKFVREISELLLGHLTSLDKRHRRNAALRKRHGETQLLRILLQLGGL